MTSPVALPALPHGRTARRVEWLHLPPGVRREVERRIGGEVVEARSQDAGFTPGLACVLSTADGCRVFIKAAAVKAQRLFAEAYREEARKVAGLPPGTPAARLLWTAEVEDWFVIAFEAVASRQPHRPWTVADLDIVLDTLETVAEVLTPPPADLELPTLAEELADLTDLWGDLAPRYPGRPGAGEMTDLAARLPEILDGQSVVHSDVRDDNVLIRPDGTALLADWNWPSIGPAWVDTLTALIGPCGDGLDVERVLATRPLTRDVPAEHIDVLLAALTGFFLTQADLPVPSSSPHLRASQRWQGEVCWAWLARRRGW